MEYNFHDFVNIYPVLPKAELKILSDDIKQNGLLEPITMWNDFIVDGRNRFLACKMANIESRFQYKNDLTELELLRYITSKNSKRRNLTPIEKAAIASIIFEKESMLIKQEDDRKKEIERKEQELKLKRKKMEQEELELAAMKAKKHQEQLELLKKIQQEQKIIQEETSKLEKQKKVDQQLQALKLQKTKKRIAKQQGTTVKKIEQHLELKSRAKHDPKAKELLDKSVKHEISLEKASKELNGIHEDRPSTLQEINDKLRDENKLLREENSSLKTLIEKRDFQISTYEQKHPDLVQYWNDITNRK